jgi:hypothetical protein
MAKMFYTLDETKAALGRNDEGIKQLSREGRLREFRDGQKLMFKADQVEALKAEMAGGGAEISLVPDEPAVAEGPGGTGAAPALPPPRARAPGGSPSSMSMTPRRPTPPPRRPSVPPAAAIRSSSRASAPAPVCWT